MIILFFLMIFTFNIFSSEEQGELAAVFVPEGSIVKKSEEVVKRITGTPGQIIPGGLMGTAINLQRMAETVLMESDRRELRLDIRRISLDSRELGEIADMRNPAAYAVEELTQVRATSRFMANLSVSRASSPRSLPDTPRSGKSTPRRTSKSRSLHGSPQ